MLFTESVFLKNSWHNIFTAKRKNGEIMEREIKNTNSIFSYAFIGSLLFVAALAYTFSNFSNILMFELSKTALALVLAIASVSLLFKAARDDRHRMREV